MHNRKGQKARLGSVPPRTQGSSQGYVRKQQAPVGRGDRPVSRSNQTAEGEGAEPFFLKQQDYKFHSIHETQFHEAELLVNPEVLETVREGDLMGLWNTHTPPTPGKPLETNHVPKERMVVLKVTLKSLAGVSPFSLRRSVRDTFDLSPEKITMCQVRPEDVQADHVELTIKGMFVPRADLYRFLNAINGETAYSGKMFNLPGMMRARVNLVNRNKKPVNAGIISKRTHVSCRSRSSRIFWLVQLSTEMYDVNQQGDCYYEVCLRFMENALDRWRELDVTHHLTVVFFCRTHFCSNKKAEPVSPQEGLYTRPILTAPDGKLYEDTYKVVVHNETRAQLGGDNMRLVWRLYDEFMEFPKTMGWYKKVDLNATSPAARNGGRTRASTAGVPEADSPELDLRDPGVRLSIPCNASSGNVLEALNVTLNVLQKHYVDRDLTRSGNSVVMISAGTGVFYVDGGLSATTTQRMMDNGIGMDMVSLSQPPLHTAPLFISKRLVPVDAAPANPQEAASAAAAKAKQHEQQQQQQQNASRQGADSPARTRGNTSFSSDEALIQENPKYEVPHFMNLTFAAAAKPRALRDASKFDAPKAPPRGLSSTPPEYQRATCIDKPVPMPKLVWPRPFHRKADGSMDMDTLCIPRILAVIVGHESSGAIDITDDHDLETPWGTGSPDEKMPASKTEEGREQTKPFALKRWHTAEEMYPQPPPGMEGAAEFARRLAESRVVSPASAPVADAAIPPLTPHGRRAKSPTGSSPSLAGRHTSEVLGTSPGGGYVGSPRSVGRSTLSQLARPWPDKDSYVGVSAQPTLRGSPRGYTAGGKPWGFGGSNGGSSSGGGGGSGGGSTPVAPSAVDTSKSVAGGATNGVSYPEFESKKMTDQVWRLMEPKFDEYDEQVDQPVIEAPRPPRASIRAVKMGDWGSRPAEATPSPFSRLSSHDPPTGGNKAQPNTGEGTQAFSSDPATQTASTRNRSSFSVSEAGGASTDGSSTASPTTPQEPTDRPTTAGGAPSSSGDRGCSSTTTRSPPGSRRWGWHKKQETVQPSTSPGNSLWPSSKDALPKFDTKLAAKSKRGGGSGGSGRPDGLSKSHAGGRSPADAAHQRAPTPLWTSHLTDDNPAPSPAGPYAESGEPPPVLALGKSPGIKSSLTLPGEHSPVTAPPPSATSVGRGSRQLRGKGFGSKTPLAGAHGPRIASTGTVPVKIERACSDGRKSEVGRKGGKFASRSSPRAVPKGDADMASDGGHGHGYGRSPVGGGWPRPSSSLETPGGLTSLKGDTLKTPMRRPRVPVHNPHSQESAGTIGPLVEQSQTPTCPSSDNTNADREAFDRDGRHQASVGSTGSATTSAAATAGGGSAGSGGFNSRRDSSGRARTSTGHSEAAVGGVQQAAVKSRLVAAEFNPFKKQDEKELLNSRTHNRRRWTHVFPPGETEFHTMDTMPGPIWNSLCQPALLPLSIDFVPSPHEMMDDYTESNHDIMLGGHQGLTLDSVKPPLEEMVAQRIAQDFQLVEQVGPRMGSRQRVAYDSLARRGRGLAENQHPTVQDGLVHILSMGHRLQTLSFDKGTGTVKVRKFTHKEGSAGNSSYDYAYSLWLPITGHVQTVQQKFFKYPQPEYPFNYVDNLISGDYTALTDATKCRRLLFNIVPPKNTTREDQEAFVTALGRLADHLNKKRKTDLDSDAETFAPVSFQLGRRSLETSTDGPGAGATSGCLIPRRRSVRMDMTVRVASAGDDARACGKGKDFEDGKDGEKGADKGIKQDEAQPHEEWLDVVHDEVVGMEQVLQLDVRWLLCSAAKVEEYVKELHSCAQDLNLRLLQVPEYARATGIHLHPLLTHPYITLPPCEAEDKTAILSSVQKHLLDTREYVRCSDVDTDWKSFGLQIPRKMDLGGVVHVNPKPSRRVYMHTSGAAFVRVAPDGLVFLQNLHWCDTGEASEQDGRAAEGLPEQLLDNLHRVVTATHLARCVVNSAISEAVDAALTKQRVCDTNTAASF